MKLQKDVSKVRSHDAIVGLIYLTSAILALQVNVNFIWIAVSVAGLQIISPITKFCPVYFILNKLMPDSTPIQNGK
jgi:hypothetical protein